MLKALSVTLLSALSVSTVNFAALADTTPSPQASKTPAATQNGHSKAVQKKNVANTKKAASSPAPSTSPAAPSPHASHTPAATQNGHAKRVQQHNVAKIKKAPLSMMNGATGTGAGSDFTPSTWSPSDKARWDATNSGTSPAPQASHTPAATENGHAKAVQKKNVANTKKAASSPTPAHS